MLSYELWLRFTWQHTLAPGSQNTSLRLHKVAAPVEHIDLTCPDHLASHTELNGPEQKWRGRSGEDRLKTNRKGKNRSTIIHKHSSIISHIHTERSSQREGWEQGAGGGVEASCHGGSVISLEVDRCIISLSVLRLCWCNICGSLLRHHGDCDTSTFLQEAQTGWCLVFTCTRPVLRIWPPLEHTDFTVIRFIRSDSDASSQSSRSL